MIDWNRQPPAEPWQVGCIAALLTFLTALLFIGLGIYLSDKV